MPDPVLSVVAISAITGAASGAAGRVLERGVDAGTDWIKSHLSKHGAEAQRRAESNAADFLLDLANRVARLERDANVLREQLEVELGSPDFAATLQSAIVSSARTADGDRHRLLAAAVTARLRHREGDAFAIAEGLAVETIPKLTSAQLAYLGLRHGVGELRYPRRSPQPHPAGEFDQRLRVLRERFHAVEKLDESDYLHMASVSCAVHGGGVVLWGLPSILSSHNWNGWAPIPHLAETEDGTWLLDVWKKGAERVTLTLIGAVVASHVYFASQP
jgi:hypothetical protein